MQLDKPLITYFRKYLLAWFDQYGRHHLPWQIDKTPYKVWLSEVMLQQTQVSTVIPYFTKFYETFPSIVHLASAHLDEILSLWSGLGYYRRARFLHACAQTIMKEFSGEFPQSIEALIKLPGIGRSTAGAILSLSMDQRAAILDGNVKRVLSRFFAIEEPLNERSSMKHLWHLAEQLTPTKRFDDYNQAIMDLGATCCTRSKPTCDVCPLRRKCLAYLDGYPTKYPIKSTTRKSKPQRKTMMLIFTNNHNEILLEKRNHEGIWPGLYSLPELEFDSNVDLVSKAQWNINIKQSQSLEPFTHQFTHFNLEVHPIICLVDIISQSTLKQLHKSALSWHSFNHILNLGLPAPVKKILTPLLTSSGYKEELHHV